MSRYCLARNGNPVPSSVRFLAATALTRMGDPLRNAPCPDAAENISSSMVPYVTPADILPPTCRATLVANVG